jgi:hypothetical protein
MRVHISGERADVKQLLQNQKGWAASELDPKTPPTATTFDRVSVELTPAPGMVVDITTYNALTRAVSAYPSMMIRVS